MNAKQAKKIRKRARELTRHLPYATYRADGRLGECTKGAYKALKRGRFKIRTDSVTLPQ